MILTKNEASAGRQATDEALTQKILDSSIAKAADTSNQHDLGDIRLDDLLAQFMALNHERYYPTFSGAEKPQELLERSMWRRLRSEIMRRAARLVLRTDHTPDWLSDRVLPLAETWSLVVRNA